ncbi:site-specific integrase [Trebonia sp.]|uniref:tyrosine-type recombinase/integrase n=1 Tax=Trebonia sp. TaxID=2767075 RepID=UPI002638695A|nr:site-specific integrase [Trebonia sp.]
MASIETNIIPAGSRKNTTGKPQQSYTVRYRDVAGKQREKTFKKHDDAKAFASAQDYKKRFDDADVSLEARRQPFNDAVRTWLDTAPWRNERTRATYVSAFTKWVGPAYEGRTVREAATMPGIARELVNLAMIDLCGAMRARARTLIVNTLDMLVTDGVIESHRVTGIKLAQKAITEEDSEDDGFVFITDEQTGFLADGGKIDGHSYKGAGIGVWLQRTMGLRICEALGVEKADFINNGMTLRLKAQASRDGKMRVPLKKRQKGQFRDVPVPEFIWDMVKGMPDGPLMPGISTKYMPYPTIQDRFGRACKALGITGFTTHSLRHQFASECLESGMNIVDLSAVLGHADPSITLKTYVHAMPDSQERTRAMMNARWAAPALMAA